MKFYRQVDLERLGSGVEGSTDTAVFKCTIVVEDHPKLKEGVQITVPKLFGDLWWHVTRVGKRRLRPRENWKVGGLT